MILAVLYLLLTFLIGLLISSYLKLKNFKKIVSGFIIGVMISTWLAFLPALMFKSMKVGIIVSFLIMISILILFIKKINLNLKIKKIEALLLMVLLFFSISTIMLTSFIERDDTFYFGRYEWGDMAFHLTLINSFSKANNFPAEYPIYAGQKMGYPFLFDFYSSILNYLGLNLKYSIFIPSILTMVSLFLLLYCFSIRLTNKKLVGVVAIILLAFSGGLGFIDFIKEGFNQGFINSMAHKIISYTNETDLGYNFLNFSVAILHQRTSLFGYAFVFLIFLLIIPDILKNKKIEKSVLVISGILTGLLVMFHAHSFLSLMILIFLLSLYYKRYDLAYFFIPAGILITMQFPLIFQQVAEGKFISFSSAWISPKNPLEFIFSWFKNLGVVLLLFVLAFFISKKENKILYLFSLSLFVIPNIIQFQPWKYDNIKILRIWFFFVVIASSEVIEKVYNIKKIGKVFAILLIILSSLAGFATIVQELNNNYSLYSYNDLQVADWAAQNTEKNAVFLIAENHNHPVPMLSGRATFRGYPGWLWSHGIKDVRAEIVKKIYEGNLSKEEIKKQKIDYIYIGEMELNSKEYQVNLTFFDNIFEKIYENQQENVTIYKVNNGL